MTDDGLEELTLRLTREDYPKAHRSGRGPDGGIDVLSDHDLPPQRAWQAKNYLDAIDWDECRASLKSAMSYDDPPPHYTYVFPRRLKKAERDFWRETFLAQQKKLYPDLEILDYWDDLVERIEGRAEIIDRLTDLAYGGYVRATLAETNQDGVNPVAMASDLVGEGELEGHAKAIGKKDPHFAYGRAGREANVGDRGLIENRLHVKFEVDGETPVPKWTLSLRQGDVVSELTAEPRVQEDVEQPEIWFAETDEGEEKLREAQIELAKGRPMSISGPAVGLDPKDIPDRFLNLVDGDGRLSKGSLELGLSEALNLELSIKPSENDALTVLTLPLYRVPARHGVIAYGSSHGAALLILEITKLGDDRLLNLVVGLAPVGEPALRAVAGFGIIKAIDQGAEIYLKCPGLLPDDGVELPAAPELKGSAANELWEMGATVAMALTALNRRDGGNRVMPGSFAPGDYYVAQIINGLLRESRIGLTVTGEEGLAPLPPGTKAEGDAQNLASFEAPVPRLLGEDTGIIVRQALLDLEILGFETNPRGTVSLRVRPSGPNPTILLERAET
jgi:hypothetical protein